MDVIKFKRGIKNWDTSYNVEIDFEYTADLEKRITEVVFYQPHTNLRVRVPWRVLKGYLDGTTSNVYVDSSGLKLEMVGNDLHISDSRFFHITVHEDQRRAIKIAARNVKERISSSVERILREFATSPLRR